MKVAIEKVGAETLEINEDIPVELWDMDSPDTKFVDRIQLNCRFKRVHKEIIVGADVITHQEIVCSRCLNSARKTLKQNFSRSYNIDNLGDSLDIGKDIREEILLNFPMKTLCEADCKGICFKCGTNLNSEKCQCSI